MSVTITRRQAVKLGEQTIERAKAHYAARRYGGGPRDISDAPEVEAFRQVIALAPAVARGINEHEGVCCPMLQTVFSIDESDVACWLAICWDDATREAGLGPANVIHINP